MSSPQSQSMKSATAAKKLGILLLAAPAEFQDNPITREQLNELLANPPEWLTELRREGPHPRQEVARKLGVSTSGLGRAGITASLTTAEIKALLEEMPDWLVRERQIQARVWEENARLRAREAERRAARR